MCRHAATSGETRRYARPLRLHPSQQATSRDMSRHPTRPRVRQPRRGKLAPPRIQLTTSRPTCGRPAPGLGGAARVKGPDVSRPAPRRRDARPPPSTDTNAIHFPKSTCRQPCPQPAPRTTQLPPRGEFFPCVVHPAHPGLRSDHIAWPSSGRGAGSFTPATVAPRQLYIYWNALFAYQKATGSVLPEAAGGVQARAKAHGREYGMNQQEPAARERTGSPSDGYGSGASGGIDPSLQHADDAMRVLRARVRMKPHAELIHQLDSLRVCTPGLGHNPDGSKDPHHIVAERPGGFDAVPIAPVSILDLSPYPDFEWLVRPDACLPVHSVHREGVEVHRHHDGAQVLPRLSKTDRVRQVAAPAIAVISQGGGSLGIGRGSAIPQHGLQDKLVPLQVAQVRDRQTKPLGQDVVHRTSSLGAGRSPPPRRRGGTSFRLPSHACRSLSGASVEAHRRRQTGTAPSDAHSTESRPTAAVHFGCS
jgi:hypothetical protein